MPADKKALLMYANKINKDLELVNQVLQTCFEENLFNETLYGKFNILTSKGIQNRYVEAVARRKEVEFITDYLLIECEDVNNKLKNVNINYLNVDGSTQSKVNKSKVEESKVKHVFKDSKYFNNYSLLEKEIGELYHKYDLKHYYQKLVIADSKYKYDDWLDACRRRS